MWGYPYSRQVLALRSTGLSKAPVSISLERVVVRSQRQDQKTIDKAKKL
jgi:hypothetical protein